MTFTGFTDMGNADYTEVFQPKPVGEPINTHVVPAVREPSPDYAAMQRMIESSLVQDNSEDKK